MPRYLSPALLGHSDGNLTDKIYTDENLLGVETAIDVLPAFIETPSQGASQGASQKPVMGWHGVTPAVTVPALNGVVRTIENKGESHDLALAGMGCHESNEWYARRGLNPHSLPGLFCVQVCTSSVEFNEMRILR